MRFRPSLFLPMSRSRHVGLLRLGALVLALILGQTANCRAASKPEPLLLVVLDPLSRELACACVKGYGQRDYRKLAARLESVLRQPVAIEFSDDLAETLAHAESRREVMIVGERLAAEHGAQKAGLKVRPVCELTGLDGETTLAAAFIARSTDTARSLKDITGRKILFGLLEADGKNAVAIAALQAAGITPPVRPDRHNVYANAVLDVLDSQATPPPVAVVPDYALRLMEGCGSVTPGELRTIGRTGPAPFITVFLSDAIIPEKREKVLKTLLAVKSSPTLLKALESRDGFKALNPEPKASGGDWPDWRGTGRNGIVPRLPEKLPPEPRLVWKKAALNGGLAGLSVSDGRLILAERDFADEHDVYRCLDAETGELLWRAQFPAPGKLDYGQFPRATPVVHAGRAYLLGAFGELRCVNVEDGKTAWKRHLVREFKAELPTWGMCSPPLVADDLLIVNPGGAKASIAALDCATGRTRWVSPGGPAAYGAFILGEFGGRRQIVGWDRNSLGGWEVKTGARLWQLVPPAEGSFNVPTPIAVNGGLVVTTENGGTRWHRFDDAGRIIPGPAGVFSGLAPDTATPVVTRDRVFGAHKGLYCLDLKADLKPLWHREDPTLGDHVALLADAERVLVATLGGELMLLDARAEQCTILSRLRLFEDDVEMYSHPALAGTRLYVRGGNRVMCIDLQASQTPLP
jgi:outer membrane protein assembly factor BamB